MFDRLVCWTGSSFCSKMSHLEQVKANFDKENINAGRYLKNKKKYIKTSKNNALTYFVQEQVGKIYQSILMILFSALSRYLPK